MKVTLAMAGDKLFGIPRYAATIQVRLVVVVVVMVVAVVVD